MNNLPSDSVDKQVGRVSVPESKNMANHTRDSQRPSVRSSPFEPFLRVGTFQPQNTVKVLSGGVVQRVLEYLDFLYQCETSIRCLISIHPCFSVQDLLIIWRHLNHGIVKRRTAAVCYGSNSPVTSVDIQYSTKSCESLQNMSSVK
jgi:hypothetical protein